MRSGGFGMQQSQCLAIPPLLACTLSSFCFSLYVSTLHRWHAYATNHSISGTESSASPVEGPP
jgi:hypothetical protein